MENSLKGLLLAAGTIITCIVISLGFFISREARDTAANGAGAINKLNAEFHESDKVLYDGLEVSGSEIINLLNKYKNEEISIKVRTKKSTTYYIQNMSSDGKQLTGSSSASIKAAQKAGSINYINPNAQFVGEVIRDINDAIIGIGFSQKA